MKRVMLALAALIGLTGIAAGQDATRVALDLGTVIGSEAGCGLKYDQDAIVRFIEANVPETDMEFMTTMNNSVWAAEREIAEFGAAQKIAHCTQVGRIARKFGFVK